VTAGEYAGYEQALGIDADRIPAGPLNRGDVIGAAELALREYLGESSELSGFAMAASR